MKKSLLAGLITLTILFIQYALAILTEQNINIESLDMIILFYVVYNSILLGSIKNV